jgi:hypothetical protein
MLLGYCLSDSEMVPVAPVITGITFIFTFHMRCISKMVNPIGRNMSRKYKEFTPLWSDVSLST